MSQKTALSFKNLNANSSSNNVASPFWSKPQTKRSKAKAIFKII